MNKKAMVTKIFKFINWLPMNNRISHKGCSLKLKNSRLIGCYIKTKNQDNKIVIQDGCLRNCHIEIFGNNNEVIIQDGSLVNCCIKILGNNNTVLLKNKVRATSAEMHIEDDYNSIVIGENTVMAGKIHLACIEGTNITIGKECLFSSDIVFRTGDSHTITDLEGARINPAKDILIKNRVWLGHRVVIGKGVILYEDTVVGAGAIVTKPFEETNVVIAGVPAKIVKRGIRWIPERI